MLTKIELEYMCGIVYDVIGLESLAWDIEMSIAGDKFCYHVGFEYDGKGLALPFNQDDQATVTVLLLFVSSWLTSLEVIANE